MGAPPAVETRPSVDRGLRRPVTSIQTPPKPDPRAVQLLNSMEEFNKSLQAWTQMMRDQVDAMSHCFTALKGFSDALPALLDSMQSGASPNSMQKLSFPPQFDRGNPRVCLKPDRAFGESSDGTSRLS